MEQVEGSGSNEPGEADEREKALVHDLLLEVGRGWSMAAQDWRRNFPRSDAPPWERERCLGCGGLR